MASGEPKPKGEGDGDHVPFPFAVPDHRFDQKNEMFKRRTWDEKIKPHGDRLYNTVKYQDKPGFTKLDYAFRNACWHIEYEFGLGNLKSDYGLYSWSKVSPKIEKFIREDGPVTHSPDENAHIVKKVARFMGADLVGICPVHPNLIYSHELDLTAMAHRELALPDGCTNAIVMAVEMDYEACRYSPNGMAGAATGLGYSRMAFTANMVAAFVRSLGYRAIPSGNDTALSIPLAMAAGLGELGRMGLLVTEAFGPRVRIMKVFTDLPLAHDPYRAFGVAEFCRTCKKCAERCPSRAIPFGDPTSEGPSCANHSGVEKWYIDPEKCFLFWVKNWMDCNNCVMVCPFNKPKGKLHDFVRLLIQRAPVFNRLMVKMDDLLGYGKSRRKESFWDAP